MPFGLPKSLWWFVVTGVLFLLQAFPFTGIFLMLVAAPFWSVILVNVGFAALAAEALVEPRHFRWIAMPVLYFGGYAFLAALSHERFAEVDAKLRAHNATLTSEAQSFSRERHDLVIDKSSHQLSGVAGRLNKDYPLDVVYETNGNFKQASHLAFRIAQQDVCAAIRSHPVARAVSVNAHAFRTRRRNKVDACQVSGPADPTRPSASVSLERRKVDGLVLPATYDTVTIRYPSGEAATLMTGYAAPLPWLPRPVIGCALISSTPAWKCSAGFMRSKMAGLGGDGAYGRANAPVIATALGLEPVALAERVAGATAQVPAALTRSIEQRLEISSANLDRIIANPSVRLTVHDIKGLRERMDLWRDRVPAMTEALVRAFDGGSATRERAGLLQDLLKRLPTPGYEPVARQILQALAARPQLKATFVRDDTLARLGELGPVALPVLRTWLLKRNRNVQGGALLGICKVGAPAASLAELIVERFESSARYMPRELRFAAFLTLHRIGRPDLATEVLGDKRNPPQAMLDEVARAVGPASGPDVCVAYNAWRRRGRS